MQDKIKVVFILPTLYAGGAERVISFVSQNLDKSIFDTSLIIIGSEKDSKFKVEDVRLIYLNKKRVLASVFQLVRLLRKLKPQVVVSSISHLNIMMGLISIIFSNIKFIGRHATITNVAKHYKTNKGNRTFSSLLKLDRIGIKNLDYIICQSSDMKNDFLTNYSIDENRVKIIHNPITQVGFIKKRSNNNEVKKFITIGRLSKIKGQLRLINILGRLTIPFHFTIIGSGAYKEAILKKIDQLGLANKITLIDYTDNVFDYLIQHDMFLQGSYSEGFPNALLESCSVGVPVLAFNVPGGTKDIVSNGVNGFLVDNEDQFLGKLQENKNWDSKKVSQYVYKKFNKEKIIGEYEQLFLDVLKK